jgi:hypothetical protein
MKKLTNSAFLILFASLVLVVAIPKATMSIRYPTTLNCIEGFCLTEEVHCPSYFGNELDSGAIDCYYGGAVCVDSPLLGSPCIFGECYYYEKSMCAAPTCTDTDGGENIGIGGSAFQTKPICTNSGCSAQEGTHLLDICDSTMANLIHEAICYDGIPMRVVRTCPTGKECAYNEKGEAYCKPKWEYCRDTDTPSYWPGITSWNILVAGTCNDNVIHSDSCKDGRTLLEYYCTDTNGNGNDDTCSVKEVDCLARGFDGCYEGACVAMNCKDTDGGKTYNQPGACYLKDLKTGELVYQGRDICLVSGKLREWYCSSDGTACLSEDVDCPSGSKCSEGPEGGYCTVPSADCTHCRCTYGDTFGDVCGSNCYTKCGGSGCASYGCYFHGCPSANECFWGAFWKCCNIGDTNMCISCDGTKGETICCSINKIQASCCKSTEICLDDGRCEEVCGNPKYFGTSTYCSMCDHCCDYRQNCGEAGVDCGGSCTKGSETEPGYAYRYEITDISGYTQYYELSDIKLLFNNTYFCYDCVDNDNDCLIDRDDPDCGGVGRDPSTCGLIFNPACPGLILCNNNGICEEGETQLTCPTDCKTVVSIKPAVTSPQYLVNVTVYFNDSRYRQGEIVNISLYIDDVPWSTCFHNVNITASGTDQTCDWNIRKTKDKYECGTHTGNMKASSLNSYFKVEASCIVPDIPAGTHKLKAIPRFYSPVVLSKSETTMTVKAHTSTSLRELLTVPVNIILAIFKPVFVLFLIIK